jgi:hypothetical protein
MTKRAKVALQAFVLFALHHWNILLAITHGDKPSNRSSSTAGKYSNSAVQHRPHATTAGF